jgi:hypothetical protein
MNRTPRTSAQKPMSPRVDRSKQASGPTVAIIGGLSRSGTTLLWKTCHRHPAIALTYEFANFRNLGRNYWKYRRDLLKRWKDPQIGKRDWREPSFRLAYLERLKRHWCRSINANVVSSVLQPAFPAVSVVGDKYPRYVFNLRDLTKDKGLKRIIIYRDCRDVTSSFLHRVRTDWKGLDFIKEASTADRIARRWVEAIETMETYRQHLHVIRYEDLVRNPAPILRGLGEYLGVESTAFPTRHIHADSVGNYRRGLSSDELESVMRVAGPTLRRLGYR